MNLELRGWRFSSYLLVIFIVIGMLLIWYSTIWGAGLISDTFQYAASARNLAHGNGFSLPYGDGERLPMTKYPPMFPILLAGFELIGLTALQGARIVNIILFGVNILLVFFSTKKLTRSYMFSLLASLLFSISFVMVEVHTWALSEPLYICLGLLSFLLIQKYFEEVRSIWLIFTALSASFVVLTRYVGLSLVISIGVILLADRISIRQRLKDALVFGSIAILPAALWTLRGYLLTQTLNDRTIGFHPLTTKNYVAAIDVIYGWFFPSSLVHGQEKLFLIFSTVILIGLVLFFLRANKATLLAALGDHDIGKKILLLHIVYIFLYGAMIIASKTWVDPDIGLSDRILSPMLVSALILLAVGLSFLWNAFGKIRLLVILFVLGLITYYVAGTSTLVQNSHNGGIGIARRGWNRSEVVQSLRTYSSYSIYTNSNSSLYLWSDRAGYGIPEFEALKEIGTDKRVLLVIFHQVPPTGKRLDELMNGLELLNEDQLVSVYAYNPKQ
jgi:Dolichyl-phosphate-mannose-protein mannosyltransferase